MNKHPPRPDDDTDHDLASSDSDILRQHQLAGDDLGPFKIYSKGELTVIGFGGEPVPDLICLSQYRGTLEKLLIDVGCRVLAIDLSGVVMIPSGLLGLLTSFSKSGIEVQLHNTSKDIVEVLELTKLKTFINVTS